LRNAVLTSLAVTGTALAAKRWFYDPLAVKKLSPQALQQISQCLGPSWAKIASLPYKTLGQLQQLLEHINHSPYLSPAQRQHLTQWIAPPPALEENPMHEVKNFMKLGLAAVGSGLLGGILGNAISGQAQQTPAQLKEGLFQLGVNIGMCGVGAAAGIKAAEHFGHGSQRLKRLGWIAAGLTAGIAAGNVVSQGLEKTVVKPLARATANDALANEPPRQVRWQDLLLHVDDLPLMLMFAGVEAVKPIIPLCFLYAGLKTGLARQSQNTTPHAAHTMAQVFGQTQATPTAAPSSAFRPPSLRVQALQPNHAVFEAFALQQ
jgi:hypothetical protein